MIFSCIVDNIDGVRGEDWGVVYKVKEQNQEYKDVPVSLPAGYTGCFKTRVQISNYPQNLKNLTNGTIFVVICR